MTKIFLQFLAKIGDSKSFLFALTFFFIFFFQYRGWVGGVGGVLENSNIFFFFLNPSLTLDMEMLGENL